MSPTVRPTDLVLKSELYAGIGLRVFSCNEWLARANQSVWFHLVYSLVAGDPAFVYLMIKRDAVEKKRFGLREQSDSAEYCVKLEKVSLRIRTWIRTKCCQRKKAVCGFFEVERLIRREVEKRRILILPDRIGMYVKV